MELASPSKRRMHAYEATAENVIELARDALRHPGLFEGAELRRALSASAESLAALGAEVGIVQQLRSDLMALPRHASARDVAEIAIPHLQRLIG
jgi:hypothetical protein